MLTMPLRNKLARFCCNFYTSKTAFSTLHIFETYAWAHKARVLNLTFEKGLIGTNALAY